jgi:hypothetical protein
MTEGFTSSATALAMRDLIKEIASGVVDRLRPAPRYATVIAIDPVANQCTVNFPGDTTAVPITMGNVKPMKVGQVVRIVGLSGDKYIDGVLGMATSSVAIAPTFNTPAKYSDYNGTSSATTKLMGYVSTAGWLIMDGDIVFTGASPTSGENLFTIPGWIPADGKVHTMQCISSATNLVIVNISGTGQFTYQSGTWTSGQWLLIKGPAYQAIPA